MRKWISLIEDNSHHGLGEWFSGSEVVDENDEPLVVYHGTSHEFSQFDAQKIKTGLGFHFTDDKDHAALFGPVKGYYLSIKNPYYGDILETDETFSNPEARVEWIKNRLQEGHDGAIFEGSDNYEFVVFNPDQIRPANPTNLTEAASSGEITRWVDAGGALSYIRYDAMIGRVRHWLPKQISGLDKIYPKTGLSFGIPNTRSRWNAHGDEGICFVVARDRLDNLICDIDGQAVYEFSDAYDFYKAGGGAHDLQRARDRAIEDSRNHPDEAFVVGNIRELHKALVRIEISNLVDPKVVRKIMAYAEQHGIEIR